MFFEDGLRVPDLHARLRCFEVLTGESAIGLIEDGVSPRNYKTKAWGRTTVGLCAIEGSGEGLPFKQLAAAPGVPAEIDVTSAMLAALAKVAAVARAVR